MSWMDSWSRPGKSQAVPPPLYLTNSETKYCHSCGRVISDRRSHKADTSGSTATPAKYCSSRCRSHKPRGKDRKIEEAFIALLNEESHFDGEEISAAVKETVEGQGKGKGETRVLVPCSAAETLVYGDRKDPNKTFGRRKNRASRAIENGSDEDEELVPSGAYEFYEDELDPTAFAGKKRPPQHLTNVNGSVGGEKGWAERTEESEEAGRKRLEGQKVAEEKEAVKRAARRLVVFGVGGPSNERDGKASDDGSDAGHASDDHKRKDRKGDKNKGKGQPGEKARGKGEARYCEAVMQGKVVEPSFAKGDWAVRWRE